MSSELYLELLDGLKSKKPKTFLALARTGQMVLTDRLRKKFKDASFFDFCESPSSGDIAAELTTLEDQGLVIFKDLDVESIFEESILEMYQAIFNNREIVLTLANGKKKSIELANFHIVVVCRGIVSLPESLVDTFDQVLKEDDDCEASFAFHSSEADNGEEDSEDNDQVADEFKLFLQEAVREVEKNAEKIFKDGFNIEFLDEDAGEGASIDFNYEEDGRWNLIIWIELAGKGWVEIDEEMGEEIADAFDDKVLEFLKVKLSESDYGKMIDLKENTSEVYHSGEKIY